MLQLGLISILLVSPFAMAAIPHEASPARANLPATPITQGTIALGTYDLEIVFGGGTIPGTLVLTTAGDSIDAKMSLGDHSPPIQSVKRSGSTLTLSGAGNGVTVTYELKFTGDQLAGKFVFNGDTGTLTGKRRK
jgi:hypothetical protein